MELDSVPRKIEVPVVRKRKQFKMITEKCLVYDSIGRFMGEYTLEDARRLVEKNDWTFVEVI